MPRLEIVWDTSITSCCARNSAVQSCPARDRGKFIQRNISVYRCMLSDARHFSVHPLWRHQMETFSATLVRGIHRSPVNFPNEGWWRGALFFFYLHLNKRLIRWFRHRSKKISKLRVTGLCADNSPLTGVFPTQKASNAEMFSFDDVIMKGTIFTGEVTSELYGLLYVYTSFIPNKTKSIKYCLIQCNAKLLRSFESIA